jgi:hypothetical protein
VLYDYGLLVVIRSYIEEYKARYGIQVQLDQPEPSFRGSSRVLL